MTLDNLDNPVQIKTGNANLTDEQFLHLAAANRPWRTERTAGQTIILMSPLSYKAARFERQFQKALEKWFQEAQVGDITYSSTGFRLPNGAIRSPDAAWLAPDRVSMVNQQNTEKIVAVCPNFIVEIRSPTDDLGELRAKLEEWLANGAELGWLIDPRTETVYVHRPGRPVQEVQGFGQSLSADPEVPGFALDLAVLIS